MNFTYTRTVNTIEPANPYLVCAACRRPVEYFSHTGDGQGVLHVQPCDHTAGYENTCPSWGPVDGCRCADHLGYVPHAAIPEAMH